MGPVTAIDVVAQAILADLLTRYQERPGQYTYDEEFVITLGEEPTLLWPAVHALEERGFVHLLGHGDGYTIAPTPLALGDTVVGKLAEAILDDLLNRYQGRAGMYDEEAVAKLGGDPRFLWPAVQVLQAMRVVRLQGHGPGYIIEPIPQ